MADPQSIDRIVVSGDGDQGVEGARVLQIDAEWELGADGRVVLAEGRDVSLEVGSVDLSNPTDRKSVV